MDGTEQHAARPAAPAYPSSFLQLQLVGWAVFALIDLVNRQLAYFDLSVALALTAIVYPTMVLLSGGLHRLYRRHFAGTVLRPATLAAMAALSFAGAGVMVAVLAGARAAFGWNVPNWSLLEEVALPFFHYAISLFGWSLLYFWIQADHLRQMARDASVRAQADALRAEIQQLRLQINPHFLFNALNGVAEEVPEHPAVALAMLRDLTAYFRHVLAGIRVPLVTVAAETEALAAYLRIQEARFGPRLRAVVAVEPAAAGRLLPNSLLQPLVENAVEHGDRSEVLEVSLRIAAQDGGLRIEVRNNGALGGARPQRASHGIGIDNLRRRLAVHYPGRHDFTLDQEGGARRVVATLRLEGEPCSVS